MPRSGSSCSTEPRPQPRFRSGGPGPGFADHRRRIGVVVAALAAGLASLVVGPIAMAWAESPTEVAEELEADGVFVAPGRELDADGLAQAVQEARARGLLLVVVGPNDPQPTASAFARRVAEASGADVAIVFPTEGGLEAFAIEEFQSAHLRAVASARSKSSEVDAVEAYTEQLLTEPERSLPPIIGQLITIVVLLALVLAAAVAIEQLLRRLLRPSRGPKSPSSGRPRRDLRNGDGTLVDR